MSLPQAYMSAYFLCAKNLKHESLLLFHVYSYRINPEIDKAYKEQTEMPKQLAEKILEIE